MGVSEYTLVEALPENLKGALPTVQEIEFDLLQMQQQEMDNANGKTTINDQNYKIS